MKTLTIVKKVYNKLNNRTLFSDSFEQDKIYLNSFEEPMNNFERSFYQYKCQIRHQYFYLKIFQNVVSIIIFPILFFKITKVNKENAKCDAILLSLSMNLDYVPNDLKSQYKNIVSLDVERKISYNSSDIKFMLTLFLNYYSHPFFLIKTLLKVMEYSDIINKYKPRVMLVNNEFSFTSSILTEYCNSLGIKHINLMHGEKLFNIRDSFANYDTYYVWDEFYIKLLSDLRMDSNQFVISIPNCLRMDFSHSIFKYKYTYYLGDETRNELMEIKKTLKKIKIQNEDIIIRMHPRYSNQVDVKLIFSDYSIDDGKNNTIFDSLSQTEYAISLYSTVLFQAFLNDRKVIIDDVSNYKRYRQLLKLDYILLSKNVIFFTDYLKGEF